MDFHECVSSLKMQLDFVSKANLLQLSWHLLFITLTLNISAKMLKKMISFSFPENCTWYLIVTNKSCTKKHSKCQAYDLWSVVRWWLFSSFFMISPDIFWSVISWGAELDQSFTKYFSSKSDQIFFSQISSGTRFPRNENWTWTHYRQLPCHWTCWGGWKDSRWESKY